MVMVLFCWHNEACVHRSAVSGRTSIFVRRNRSQCFCCLPLQKWEKKKGEKGRGKGRPVVCYTDRLREQGARPVCVSQDRSRDRTSDKRCFERSFVLHAARTSSRSRATCHLVGRQKKIKTKQEKWKKKNETGIS